MKFPSILLPLTALVVAAVALHRQHQDLSALAERTTALQKSLEVAEQAASTRTRPASSSFGKAGEVPAAVADKARWQKLLDLRNPAVGNALMPDPGTLKRFYAMSAAELVSQLDEIDALDISDNDKVVLEMFAGRFLTDKDPKESLLRLSNRLDRSEMGWMLNDAFGKWLATDGSGAVQWLDRQISSGAFDTKTLREDNPTHSMMEKTAIQSLLDKDPKGAGARLVNLPANQQDVILGDLLWEIKPASDKAFAQAVRAGVPEEQRTAMLERLTRRLDQMGLERIGTFLDHIEATPEERSAITGRAVADKIDSDHQSSLEEHVQKIRAWGASHDPTVLDRATGEGLGEQAFSGDFERIARLVTKYQRDSGSDDVLIAFLRSTGAARHPQGSLSLAGQIQDPVRKAEFRKAFTKLAEEREK